MSNLLSRLTEKKAIKKAMKFQTVPMSNACHTHSFADCKPAPAQCIEEAFPNGYTVPKQEGITPMNYANVANAVVSAPPSDTSIQRKYLEGRLQDIYYTKRDPLEAKFGLTDDDAPRTPKEFKERMDAGKFQIRGIDIDKDKGEQYRYWHWTDLIRWRDPAVKADQEGFDAAKKDLKAKRQAALDIIKIGEPADGLKAIQELEAWEPTGAAS